MLLVDILRLLVTEKISDENMDGQWDAYFN